MATKQKCALNGCKILFLSLVVAITIAIPAWIPEKKLVEIIAANSIDISEILASGKGEGISEMMGEISTTGATVIAIGEQSHGTSEFFKIRAKLLNLLASDSKITKIGLEAPMAEVEDLNMYLLYGRGDLKAILKTFRLYSYECEEFVSLVNGIKEINNNRKKKITFFGFDMQSPFKSLERIKDLSKQNHNIPADTIKKLLYYYSMLDQQISSHNFSKEDFDSLKYISQPILLKQNAPDNSDSLLLFQENYRQFLLLNDPSESNHEVEKMSEIRDSLMAINIKFQQKKDEKLIVLAHNGHVQRNKNAYSKTMGYFLDKNLNKRYIAIGLTTSSGFYTAFNPNAGKIVNTNAIATPDTNSIEYYFSLLNKPVIFLKNQNILKLVKKSERPTKYKLLPYGLTDNQFVSGDAIEDFDFIINVTKTTGNKSFYLN